MPQSKPTLKLVGNCNRCGLCCTASKNGKTLYCHNLQRMDSVGMPGATFCKAYFIRYPGMPIMMYDNLGMITELGVCSHGSTDGADEENIAQWIGKGCSLRIDNGKRN